MRLKPRLSLSDRVKLRAAKYRPVEIKGDEDVMTKLKSAKRRAFLAIAAGVTAMLVPCAVQAAASSGTGTFRISATVAPSCSINSGGPVNIVEGESRSVVEACNIAGGFTVSANYRQLESQERVSLWYGPNAFALSASGMHTLGQSPMATIRDMVLRFDDVQLNAPVVLTLTIAPR